MHILIVGGGVAGVCCARKLRQLKNEITISLVTASKHVKTIHNWVRIGQFTELFDVREEGLSMEEERIDVIRKEVVKWIEESKKVVLSDGCEIYYDKLVIATGASAKNPFYSNPHVLSVRDTTSAVQLQERLKGSRKVCIVGNGGIATELVYELKNIHIVWCIRDSHPSAVYFDEAITNFLAVNIQKGREIGEKNEQVVRRMKYGDGIHIRDAETTSASQFGCALGPDWSTAVKLEGGGNKHTVEIIHNVSVTSLQCTSELETNKLNSNGLTVNLSNGDTLTCDIVIWATGVIPNSAMWKRDCAKLEIASDDGVVVNDQMMTSIDGVFACGDVCTVEWPHNDLWYQMRTWTQARQMGEYCASTVLARTPFLDFCFEMFAHCTNFYGHKVILLGDYKGAHQPNGWYAIERIISSDQFVRCVMYNSHVRGAILVGDTDLEETLENLILNQTDMTGIEENFLDPTIDIEDYFD